MLLASMSSSQFAEWMAFASVEPFGEIRQELRHGQHLSLVANINRDAEKRKEPFSAADFMNYVDLPEERKPEAETPAQIAARMQRELFRVN